MWTLPRDVPDLKDIDTIAIDTEIKDLGLAQGIGSGWFNANGEVLGISLAYTNANASVKYTRYYFPLAHAGENISRELYKQLQTTLQNYTGTIVFHNAVFDIGWLGTLGITFRKEARIVDTGYAAALLDENRFSYRLDDLAKEDLGIGKDYTILEQRMQEMRIRSMSVMMTRLKELPAADVGPYAEQDAECTLRLWELYSKQIEDNRLTKVFDLECRGIPLLIAMRKQGVPIDLAKVHQLIDNFKEREAKIQAELDAMAGEPFPNTRTAKQVEIIVRVVGKEHFTKSSAGNYLTGKKHVGKLKHPFLEKIKELNSVRKLRKDFLENFLKFEINGRIHAEFHPLKTNREGSSNIISTKTGRYSSTCIAEGTLVSLPGEDKPIESIQVGDIVYCYNEKGELTTAPVTAVTYKGEKECLALTWKGTGNRHTGSLVCTPDHWLKTNRGWVPAEDVLPSDSIYHLHKTIGERVRLYYRGGTGETEEQFLKTNYFKASNSEHIHHIDHNKLNNHLDNLVVMPASEHNSIHAKLLQQEGRIDTTSLHKKECRPAPKCGAENHNWKSVTKAELLAMIRNCNGVMRNLPMDYLCFVAHCEHEGIDWRAEAGKYNRKFIAHTISIEQIAQAFANNCGKITLAAKELGVGYTTLRDLCKKHGYCYNHKVVSKTSVGVRKVYDITVAEHHNFIANELCVHNCPNLTNIPADGELGKLIRSCFIPDKGCDWFCADYSQQEYRWAAHLAIRAKVRGWETVKRMYEEDPNLDFHNMGSQLLFGNTDPHNRKKVKTLGFGILYGQGLDGFASALGCSREEAAALLEEYREKVPFVTSIMKQAKAHVDNKGCIRTYYGRIRHYDFFEVNDSDRKVAKELGIVKGQMAAITKTMTKGDPWYNRTLKRYKTYSAINSACQGSAADQTKAAAVYMFEKYGIVPYIIVHDEFNIPVPAGDQSVGQKVIDVMENIFKLAIPVKAEGGTGANWAEAKG